MNTMTGAGGILTESVRNYINTSGNIQIRSMVELAPGVVCVHDNWNHLDVYFDAKQYRIRDEKIWKGHEELLFPSGLKENDVGVLPGNGSMRPVTGFDDALEFAKRQLISQPWYDKPVVIR